MPIWWKYVRWVKNCCVLRKLCEFPLSLPGGLMTFLRLYSYSGFVFAFRDVFVLAATLGGRVFSQLVNTSACLSTFQRLAVIWSPSEWNSMRRFRETKSSHTWQNDELRVWIRCVVQSRCVACLDAWWRFIPCSHSSARWSMRDLCHRICAWACRDGAYERLPLSKSLVTYYSLLLGIFVLRTGEGFGVFTSVTLANGQAIICKAIDSGHSVGSCSTNSRYGGMHINIL